MANRRTFLKQMSSAALVSAAVPHVLFGEKASRIPLAFSTLGCPAWEWKKILDFAHDHGFAAIELRGLQGSMDLPANPVFAPDRIEQTKLFLFGRQYLRCRRNLQQCGQFRKKTR